MLLWICGFTPAIAGPFDTRAPAAPGEVTLALTGSLRSFSTLRSAHNAPQQLPASWGVAAVELSGEVGLRPHLSVGASLPWWDATPKVLDAATCESWGACEAVRAPGDLTLSVRSPWSRGPWRAVARVEGISGVAYRRHLESLGAPGNGNADLRIGGALGRSGAVGPLRWGLDAGGALQLSAGRAPNALQAGARLALGGPALELAVGWSTHQSIHGVDFDVAVADPSDPLRFTDLDVDLQRVDASLRVAVGPPEGGLGLVAGGWMDLSVDNGPADLRGARLGVEWRGQGFGG